MGFMQLSDFETDLQSALGQNVGANSRLDRWINFGYLDLATAEDFEILDAVDTSQSTTNGVNFVNVPTNTMIVKIIRDTTHDNKLQWVNKDEYWRQPQSQTGNPIRWTRDAGKLLLHPVPNGAFQLQITYKKPPTLLASSSDKTVLPDAWDPAVFYLAVHHAFMALGQEGRAMAWLQRAASYMQSRLSEVKLHAVTPGLGPSLPSAVANAGPPAPSQGG